MQIDKSRQAYGISSCQSLLSIASVLSPKTKASTTPRVRETATQSQRLGETRTQISSISTVSPSGGSSGTEKPFSTRYSAFFSHGSNGIAADAKHPSDAALRNPLGQGAFDVGAFCLCEFCWLGVEGESFFAKRAAASRRSRAIETETNDTRSVLAMRASNSDHAPNLSQSNQRGKAHSPNLVIMVTFFAVKRRLPLEME